MIKTISAVLAGIVILTVIAAIVLLLAAFLAVFGVFCGSIVMTFLGSCGIIQTDVTGMLRIVSYSGTFVVTSIAVFACVMWIFEKHKNKKTEVEN